MEYAKSVYLAAILNNLPCQLLVIDKEARIVFVNDAYLEEQRMSKEDLINKKIEYIWPGHSLPQMITAPKDSNLAYLKDQTLHLHSGIWIDGQSVGAVELILPLDAFDPFYNSLYGGDYENLEADIKAIFSSSYDVIYASNGQGITQKVSAACEELWGLKAEQMIGRSVFDLEEEGVYRPSITRLVLETKQRVQAFQVTKTGRKLMVVGTPITNQKGEVVQVINLSRDITSEKNMQIELDNIRSMLDAYRHELAELRSKNLEHNQFVYTSDAMTNVARMALKVSDVDSTVLITGESGVGKEVLATFIQSNSLRKDRPYIKINCGAISESLLESELFGYEKGAFTGANKEGKPGLFELANHGTLFLDEIAEISPNMQIKLLRVLQEGAFLRVGGTKQIKVNVRIIAATNRNLEKEMAEGRFREDLFYRLNVVPLHIPPLRERTDDILPLAMFFLNRFNKQYGKKRSFDAEVISRFQGYRWPGNIRELQNVVERLVVLADKDEICLSDLPAHILANDRGSGVAVSRIMPLKEAVSHLEHQLIQLALAKYGTTYRAAAALGVDQSTISRKLNRGAGSPPAGR